MTLPGFGMPLGNSKDLLPVKRAGTWRVNVAGLQRMLLQSLGEGVVLHAHYGIPKSDSSFISSHKAGRADPAQNREWKSCGNQAAPPQCWGLVVSLT